MSLHIYKTGWNSLCDGNTLHAFKDGVPVLTDPTDEIWNGTEWQPLCVENYPFGFDYPHRSIFFLPGKFVHIIDFKESSGDYPWGGANNFTLRCKVSANIATPGIMWIRAFKPSGGTPVWEFAPSGTGVFVDIIKDFPLSENIKYMRIDANFAIGDEFQITTEVLAGSGGNEHIDWSGIPYPTDYDSND